MITDNRGVYLSERILGICRKKLLLEFRFLEPGLYRLNFKPWSNEKSATDGDFFYYSMKETLDRYKNGYEKEIELDYLHSMIHCLFLHPFLVGRLVGDDRRKDIAADICVANIMLDLGIDLGDAVAKRLEVFKRDHEVLTVGSLNKILGNFTEEELAKLEGLFQRDSHILWRGRSTGTTKDYQMETKCGDSEIGSTRTSEDNPMEKEEDIGDSEVGSSGKLHDNQSEDGSDSSGDFLENSQEKNSNSIGATTDINSLENDWKTASEKVKMDIEVFASGKYAGEKSGSLIQNIEAAVREKVDYRDFLLKFTKSEEVMKLDLDEFDYVYYSYGMNYLSDKKIALIEPLEYKDEKVIKDFVIAIDTSGSCSGDVVKNFLIKTYNILKDIEKLNCNFKKINLHIIQCDCVIQEDKVIHNAEDFDAYMGDFQVKGLGGTDFRPVFEYVDGLMQDKVLPEDLGGLIYFTDGFGEFPSAPPGYNTAIAFLDDDEKNNNLQNVPPWAMKIIVSEL